MMVSDGDDVSEGDTWLVFSDGLEVRIGTRQPGESSKNGRMLPSSLEDWMIGGSVGLASFAEAADA